jgi:sugar lactone lactonase YvrE
MRQVAFSLCCPQSRTRCNTGTRHSYTATYDEVGMNIRPIGDQVDLLGESCIWSHAEQALYWIDVRGKCVRRLDHRIGQVETFALPELPGSIALHADGGLVVALQSGLAHFDLPTGRLRWIAHPHETYLNQRFNDGRCDRQGRFWVGTMDDVERGLRGTLYRLGRDQALDPMLGPFAIPNSLAWSPDGDRMYFSDTTSGRIMAYDFDPASGTPSNPRIFAETRAPAAPDGSTVDAAGYLWNAEYDGGCVTRYAPDGTVDRVLELPVQRPTCCAFGGPDRSTLFVTTASQRLTEGERAAQPLAGRLLAIEVGVRGLAEPSYVAGRPGHSSLGHIPSAPPETSRISDA